MNGSGATEGPAPVMTVWAPPVARGKVVTGVKVLEGVNWPGTNELPLSGSTDGAGSVFWADESAAEARTSATASRVHRVMVGEEEEEVCRAERGEMVYGGRRRRRRRMVMRAGRGRDRD